MMRKMNKNVYGIMMAAMMAASVSVTACGGQKSTGETMTVQTQPHDDSKVSEMPVSSSVADQAGVQETEQIPEESVGMPNPFTDNDTLEEAEKNAGFSIQVPEKIGGVSATAFRNSGQEMLEVIYYNGEQEVARIRKGTGMEDISGDYTKYSDVKTDKIGDWDVTLKENDGKVVLAVWNDGTYSYSISLDEQGVSLEKEITVNEVSVTLKGDEGQYKLAIWQQDGFAYSLSYEPGGSENVFVEMIQSVQ